MVKASDPVTSLKRGFSLVYKENNQLIRSIKTETKAGRDGSPGRIQGA
jgi:hypothetical protein